ncbi:MAG: hydrogenase maturation protease [Anaerolineae bacterium]
MRTLVLGLGNPILTDDGIGIRVVREAATRCPNGKASFAEASLGGLRLLDVINGYDRVILVDAIQTRGGTPGDIYYMGPGDLMASLHSDSSHDLSLPGALKLGRRLGMQVPDDDAFEIIAIEVKDVLTFGETHTPAVSAAIPHAVDAVLAAVDASP